MSTTYFAPFAIIQSIAGYLDIPTYPHEVPIDTRAVTGAAAAPATPLQMAASDVPINREITVTEPASAMKLNTEQMATLRQVLEVFEKWNRDLCKEMPPINTFIFLLNQELLLNPKNWPEEVLLHNQQLLSCMEKVLKVPLTKDAPHTVVLGPGRAEPLHLLLSDNPEEELICVDEDIQNLPSIMINAGRTDCVGKIHWVRADLTGGLYGEIDAIFHSSVVRKENGRKFYERIIALFEEFNPSYLPQHSKMCGNASRVISSHVMSQLYVLPALRVYGYLRDFFREASYDDPDLNSRFNSAFILLCKKMTVMHFDMLYNIAAKGAAICFIDTFRSFPPDSESYWLVDRPLIKTGLKRFTLIEKDKWSYDPGNGYEKKC